MGRRTPFINDFRSGEMTPGLGTRSDLKAYAKGCMLLKNAMPIPEGGIIRVPGTKYINSIKQIEEGWCLRITKSGGGFGDVTAKVGGTPEGIDCGAVCYVFYVAGTEVVLHAEEDSESTFTGWSGEGYSGTADITITMDRNKIINAEFADIVKGDYLIGWYKFNEGAGAVALNSAINGALGGGNLPDLTIVNPVGDFWTDLVGFGSTPRRDADINHAYADFVNRTIGGSAAGNYTFGLFIKFISSPPNIGNVTPDSYGVTGSSYLRHLYNNIGPVWQNLYWFDVGGAPGSLVADIPGYAGGEWWFLFTTNDGRLARVRANGTKAIGGVATGWGTSHLCAAIMMGASNVGPPGHAPSFGAQASYGDAIFYNFTTLTNTEWKAWYNKLRARYGMDAPSGW